MNSCEVNWFRTYMYGINMLKSVYFVVFIDLIFLILWFFLYFMEKRIIDFFKDF